ncbi:hypothetical protein EVAR_77698_1 [Eumeta japonica]|uniref:Uncharacterized protein n=1 Tax=Eumeta variegata TaxID=151549 RepID=A0A4C1TDM1_EUMVA|nr:hypothetical protein EVAR_77698_1 [Eumeta japonica]
MSLEVVLDGLGLNFNGNSLYDRFDFALFFERKGSTCEEGLTLGGSEDLAPLATLVLTPTVVCFGAVAIVFVIALTLETVELR